MVWRSLKDKKPINREEVYCKLCPRKLTTQTSKRQGICAVCYRKTGRAYLPKYKPRRTQGSPASLTERNVNKGV